MIGSSRASLDAQHKWAGIAMPTLALGLSFIFAAPSSERSAIVHQPDSNPTAAEWMRFDTDACGSVDRAGSRHSMVNKSSAPDDSDEDLWAEGWGLSDEGTVVAQQWIVHHPGVAIVTDAIEKSCDSGALRGDDPDESTTV